MSANKISASGSGSKVISVEREKERKSVIIMVSTYAWTNLTLDEDEFYFYKGCLMDLDFSRVVHSRVEIIQAVQGQGHRSMCMCMEDFIYFSNQL